MKFVALISGGKDSIFAIYKLKEEGHQLVALLYMKNTKTIDSFMYQTVGNELIHLYSQCLNVPLHIHNTKADCKNDNLKYIKTENDEVEDLFNALSKIKNETFFEGVSSGAILSKYQKNRVEYVCERLNVCSLAPLWNYDQKSLLDEMILSGIDARIVKIASPGLTKICIGSNLIEIKEKIDNLPEKLRKWFNYCGEGGEYETIVLDAPLFIKKINIIESDICIHPDEVEREWNVYFIKIKKFSLLNK
ncbi:TIGR00289 family protein [Edhazardia aedis USNM 41457]|uniref:Diphthine--ammonia ligase n=1 Tax=Edhazardia aedis (strain USNM 41457) TaxID=1003232 RepID=J8ZVJ5_EDHAE|nr:TIGR00289 family protein [Edhazardia aedis USNM 41457]|eukprot:EJW03668.1 TIGR00289 family protein [Edhazardia aedis USNM 41457]